jgi:drug/metabolite transporter (DMT)-like permease
MTLFVSLRSLQDRVGYLYGFLAAVFFSAYILINKHVYLNYEVNALDYALTFMISAGLCALASRIIVRTKKKTHYKDVGKLIMNGLIAGFALGVFVYGQGFTTATNASILATSTTITTAIFSWFMIKSDRVTRAQLPWFAVFVVGIYMAIVGVQWLVFNSGDAIILAASFMLGYTNVYSRQLMRKNLPETVTDVRLISAAALALVIGLLFREQGFLVLNASYWPLVAGFFLWLTIRCFFASIHRINPSRAIILASSHPVFTPFLGMVLFNEPYTLTKLIGGVLILFGVININKKRRVTR